MNREKQRAFSILEIVEKIKNVSNESKGKDSESNGNCPFEFGAKRGGRNRNLMEKSQPKIEGRELILKDPGGELLCAYFFSEEAVWLNVLLPK